MFFGFFPDLQYSSHSFTDFNPNLRTKSHKAIQIRPHIFLLDVLLNAERFITDDEYNLFVSRAQKHDDIDLVLEFIEHWRSLTDEDQRKIFPRYM